MYEASLFIFTTIYFWKVSIDWSYYFILVLVLNSIGFVGVCILPESPRMLLSLGK